MTPGTPTICLNTRNKKICGLRVGISIVFKILDHFKREGSVMTPWAPIVCVIELVSTQGTRKYVV